MRQSSTIQLLGGGPGSGCNPAVAEPRCGRPKGSAKYADRQVKGNILTYEDEEDLIGLTELLTEWTTLYEIAYENLADANGDKDKLEFLELASHISDNLKDDINDILESGHRNTYVFTLGAWKDEPVMVGVITERAMYNELYVDWVVANPDTVGTRSYAKDLVQFVNKFAKDKGIKKIEYVRANKGRRGQSSKTRSHKVAASAIIKYLQAVGIKAGGKGSGCNPDVAKPKCGRPKKETTVVAKRKTLMDTHDAIFHEPKRKSQNPIAQEKLASEQGSRLLSLHKQVEKESADTEWLQKSALYLAQADIEIANGNIASALGWQEKALTVLHSLIKDIWVSKIKKAV